MDLETTSFANKAVLITGGASGIGKVAALFFAQKGAAVVFADINEQGGKDFELELRNKGLQANFVLTDVTQSAEVEKLVQMVISRYGKLDVAINNAGGIIPPDEAGTAVHDTLDEGWHNNIAVNLNGVFYSMKFQIQHMLQQEGGIIINTASAAGLVVETNFASVAYSAAKAGMIHLSRWAAIKYAPNGIRVNVIAPGVVATDGTKVLNQDIQAMLARHAPMNRMVEPSEIVQTMAWLCSDGAKSITGIVLPIDGGIAAR